MNTNHKQLHALGDGTRLAILERLRRGPSSVADLARCLPVSRPAVSQHLRVLKAAKLVDDAPAGAKRIYRLEPAGFASLRMYLDRFWSDALEALRAKLEEE